MTRRWLPSILFGLLILAVVLVALSLALAPPQPAPIRQPINAIACTITPSGICHLSIGH